MNKAFEKILERIQEERELSYADFSRYVDEVSPCLDAEYDDFFHRGLERASRLVKEVVEEYNSGWIPCSERLPEEYGDYLVWWTDITRGQYYEIVEYEPNNGWIGDIPQSFEGKYSVIAWQPLPEPFKERD